MIGSEKLASAGRMAAVLAHEINNPLAAVMNLLCLAQTTADTPAPVHQYLKMAEDVTCPLKTLPFGAGVLS